MGPLDVGGCAAVQNASQVDKMRNMQKHGGDRLFNGGPATSSRGQIQQHTESGTDAVGLPHTSCPGVLITEQELSNPK